MKIIFYALTATVLLSACQKNQDKAVTYTPRVLTATEKFNSYPENKSDTLALQVVEPAKDSNEPAEIYAVKFRDTLIRIQTNPADTGAVADKFSTVEYVNTQRTALLVQIADNSGLEAPVYLITITDNKPEVISLYRASTGKEDKKFTKGILRTGRDGYIVNNDFFVTNVNAKVYLIKRQDDAERIQGDYMLKSPDKQTLVFMTASSFYEVHYPTGQNFTQPIKTLPTFTGNDLFAWIQQNYAWQRVKDKIMFLKPTTSDKIIGVNDFK